MHRATLLFTVLCFTILASPFTEAKYPEPTSLDFEPQRIQAYEYLVTEKSHQAEGIEHRFKPEGKRLLRIDGQISYELPDGARRGELDYKRVELVAADGTKYTPLGHFFQIDMFQFFSRPIIFSKSSFNRSRGFNIVFLIDAEAAGPFTLRFGNFFRKPNRGPQRHQPHAQDRRPDRSF